MQHIAILSHKSVLDKILAGQKTVESRFTRLKTLPFGQIKQGDLVFFKISGGPVLGKAMVGKVEEYDNLTPGLVSSLAKRYEKELAISPDFLIRKLDSKFASLIFLENVEECQPWNFKQEGRAGWIILNQNINPGKNLKEAPEELKG